MKAPLYIIKKPCLERLLLNDYNSHIRALQSIQDQKIIKTSCTQADLGASKMLHKVGSLKLVNTERINEINRENKSLVNRLNSIQQVCYNQLFMRIKRVHRQPSENSLSQMIQKTQMDYVKKKNYQDIANFNEKFAYKLQNCKPDLCALELSKQYKQNQLYTKNLRRFHKSLREIKFPPILNKKPLLTKKNESAKEQQDIKKDFVNTSLQLQEKQQQEQQKIPTEQIKTEIQEN